MNLGIRNSLENSHLVEITNDLPICKFVNDIFINKNIQMSKKTITKNQLEKINYSYSILFKSDFGEYG